MLTLSNAKRYLGLTDRSCIISANGSIATVTLNDHGIKTVQEIEIGGNTKFNGTHIATRINVNQFTFTTTETATDESAYLAANDFILNLILSGIDNYINEATGLIWSDSEVVTDKILDCLDDGIVLIPKAPLVSIESITISYDRDFSNSQNYTVLQSKDYLMYEELNQVELLGSICDSVFGVRKSVKISYTTGPIPKGLEQIGYELLGYFYRTWNDKAQHLSSRTSQSEQVIFTKNIPDYIEEMLAPYKSYKIGGGIRSARPLFK